MSHFYTERPPPLELKRLIKAISEVVGFVGLILRHSSTNGINPILSSQKTARAPPAALVLPFPTFMGLAFEVLSPSYSRTRRRLLEYYTHVQSLAQSVRSTRTASLRGADEGIKRSSHFGMGFDGTP